MDKYIKIQISFSPDMEHIAHGLVTSISPIFGKCRITENAADSKKGRVYNHIFIKPKFKSKNK